MGQLDTCRQAPLIKAMNIFRKGQHNVVKAKADHIIQIARDVLRIAHTEIAHTELHSGFHGSVFF